MKAMKIIKFFEVIGTIIFVILVLLFGWFCSYLVAGSLFLFSILSLGAAVEGGYGQDSQIRDLRTSGKLFLAGIVFTILLFVQGYFGFTALMADAIHELFK